MTEVKVIICGSRTFSNYGLLAMEMYDFLDANDEDSKIEVVCGGAKGADKLGKQWAESMEIKVADFNADWNKYGRKAGYLRNKQMAEYATHCIAFWDGESKGTKMMIDLAHEHKLITRVVKT